MNHLKTGNAYFGAGSYVKYKFNSTELQETGLYAMDWRNYMPDIGRFAGLDALAESYADLTPNHFAANNPISFSDPTGLYSTDHNGNYSTTNTGEISKLQSYFGSGGSVDGVGNFINENETFKEDIPGITFNGKGNKDTWNLGSNYLSNSYSMYNAILQGLNGWNFQTNARVTSEGLAGVKSDGPVKMIGGHGDILGLYDIGGQVMSTWEPENQYLAMAVGALAIVATKGKATDDVLKAESNIWRIGAYKEMRGLEAGLDAHHVGQSAVMKKLVAGYDHKLAPTILVPKLGHTIGTGVVSRSTSGFTSARQVVARDIMELRRVYGGQGIPNSALQELIQMNKTMYPNAFIK